METEECKAREDFKTKQKGGNLEKDSKSGG